MSNMGPPNADAGGACCLKLEKFEAEGRGDDGTEHITVTFPRMGDAHSWWSRSDMDKLQEMRDRYTKALGYDNDIDVNNVVLSPLHIACPKCVADARATRRVDVLDTFCKPVLLAKTSTSTHFEDHIKQHLKSAETKLQGLHEFAAASESARSPTRAPKPCDVRPPASCRPGSPARAPKPSTRSRSRCGPDSGAGANPCASAGIPISRARWQPRSPRLPPRSSRSSAFVIWRVPRILVAGRGTRDAIRSRRRSSRSRTRKSTSPSTPAAKGLHEVLRRRGAMKSAAPRSRPRMSQRLRRSPGPRPRRPVRHRAATLHRRRRTRSSYSRLSISGCR